MTIDVARRPDRPSTPAAALVGTPDPGEAPLALLRDLHVEDVADLLATIERQRRAALGIALPAIGSWAFVLFVAGRAVPLPAVAVVAAVWIGAAISVTNALLQHTALRRRCSALGIAPGTRKELERRLRLVDRSGLRGHRAARELELARRLLAPSSRFD